MEVPRSVRKKLRMSLGTRTSRRQGIKAIPGLGKTRNEKPRNRLKQKIAAWKLDNPVAPTQAERHATALTAQAKFQDAVRAIPQLMRL
jgi:hypothetical protein